MGKGEGWLGWFLRFLPAVRLDFVILISAMNQPWIQWYSQNIHKNPVQRINSRLNKYIHSAVLKSLQSLSSMTSHHSWPGLYLTTSVCTYIIFIHTSRICLHYSHFYNSLSSHLSTWENIIYHSKYGSIVISVWKWIVPLSLFGGSFKTCYSICHIA